MKRLFISLLLLVPVMTFAGCGAGDDSSEIDIPEVPNDPGNDDDDNDNSGTVTPGNGKILIAWFSRWGNTNYAADVDATTGASILVDKGTRRGTTEMVARYIQTAVGGDLHLIETSEPFRRSSTMCATRTMRSRLPEHFPHLKTALRIWTNTILSSSATRTGHWMFHRRYVRSSPLMTSPAKQSFRFATHDGYGAGRTYNSVKEEATGANVLEGIAIEATDVPSAESQVQDWLERIGIEREEPQGASVRITAGGHTFTGEWLDTPLADEIRGMFPLTATLGRYGGREYYGSMPRRPTNTEEGQLRFENGDITYCPSNNTIAIFYAKADDPDMGQLTMRIIPIGKVTSDLMVFDEMDSRLEFTFDNVQ